jgi:hypothetical protein
MPLHDDRSTESRRRPSLAVSCGSLVPYARCMENRHGEPAKTYFRSNGRATLIQGKWYFATREGIDVGPYESQKQAEAASARLAAALNGVDDPIAVEKIIREFMYLKRADVRMP